MNYKELFEEEYNRKRKTLNIIHLYKESNGPWYKAYEWSAFLMEFYPNNLSEPLRPTKKKYPGINGEMINVGLQLKSFDKYVPGGSVISCENGDFEIEVDLDLYDKDITCENYEKELEKWKKSVVLSDTKSKKGKPAAMLSNPVTLFKIYKDVICYDTYGKSEDDLREFIMKLKNECSSLLC